MRYKALKYFRSTVDYQKFLQNGGTSLDSVNIAGVDYTMEEYDSEGKNIVYANRRTGTAFQLDTSNRYKNGFGDTEVTEIYPASSYRNDIVYID